MQAGLKRAGRALLWVGAVVLAANVENIGDRVGITNLFSGPLWWLRWLVSPVTYAVALIAVGIGLAAWADWLARKWDGRRPTQDAQLLARWVNLHNLANEFQDYLSDHQNPDLSLLSRTNSAYTTLRKLGVRCPDVDSGNGPVWLAVNLVFAQALWPLLREGHASEAREAAIELQQSQAETVKRAVVAIEAEQLRHPFAWT